MPEEKTRLSLEAISDLANRALCSNGFSKEQAAAIARNITAAERDGCTSHGLFRIPFYVKALNNPVIDANAVPVVSTDHSAIVHVDAGGGFCPLALEMGLPALESKAKELGIAALAIHRACNIAALWPEVEALCERGPSTVPIRWLLAGRERVAPRWSLIRHPVRVPEERSNYTNERESHCRQVGLSM